MTLDQFRREHSFLLEQYQYIEMHLEGIYAALSGKRLYIGLQDVQTANLSYLLAKVREKAEKRNKEVLSQTVVEELEQLCKDRNYWVHECYTDMVFDAKTDAPKKEADIERLRRNTDEARAMRDLLFDIKQDLIDPSMS